MLPFHRRRAQRHEARVNERWDATAHTDESKRKRLGKFIVYWIKVSWKDILAMIALAATSQALYSAPLVPIRTFPITFDASGDIVFPQFAFPDRGWIISPRDSGLISALVPIAVILLAQIRIRSFWDLNNGIFGVLYSLIIGTLFQVIIKMLIGGMRPYFLDVCQPDLSRAASHNTTGLNGVGFHHIMYSVDVCTNPDKSAIKNAMTSFPSGHSTAAFAGFVFLFLWLNAKLKVWSNHQSSFYWLALLFAPLLGAALMACALTIDQAHNWYDILGGSVIGTVSAFAAYRVLYAAIWDWRYNHIPLTRRRAFDYTAGLTPENMERATWVRKLGWGRGKRIRSSARGMGGDKKTSPAGLRSARSSATYARNGSTASPHNAQLPVTYPDTTMSRGSNQYDHNRRVVGDQMV
ncbi:phosphatidic acid phosphatase type 2/haloperoxidase [Apodospora peruviana]|uniref:Phosphatidic acid phosphatase type 2/haloperoxidase n=1 Tax=Apodospora peruviana TaxID=516989 RepID=A0AAE0ITS0_9PEZI|nr:phosphatidic acid phosphatase type 2/haloperoxidase [Apodospora peruviana]